MNFYNQKIDSQTNNNIPSNGDNISTDYFRNVSPEMLNFGINAGQDMLNKQRDKWMPGNKKIIEFFSIFINTIFVYK